MAIMKGKLYVERKGWAAAETQLVWTPDAWIMQPPRAPYIPSVDEVLDPALHQTADLLFFSFVLPGSHVVSITQNDK